MYYSKNKLWKHNNKIMRTTSLSKLQIEQQLNENDLMTHYSFLDEQEEQQKNQQQPSGIEVEENHVYFYTDVSDKSALELIRILRRLDIEMFYLSKRLSLEIHPPIHLHISSMGGVAHACLNICDAIKSCSTDVYTYVEGSAASAATLISCVGKKRFITENSFMLLHQPRGGFVGKYAEFKDECQNQDSLYEKLVKLYLNHSNMTKENIDEILSHELWFDSKKCLELGIVDKII